MFLRQYKSDPVLILGWITRLQNLTGPHESACFLWPDPRSRMGNPSGFNASEFGFYEPGLPNALCIAPTMDPASRSICSFDSASIITRAKASVPE
jgi:hypothetical protein